MKLRLFFLITLIIEIYASCTKMQDLVFISKPLLLPTLMLIAYRSGIKDKSLYLAQFFSFLGDVYLMFPGVNYFILGLACFLIGHLAYIVLFKPEVKFNWVFIILFAIVSLGYLSFLYPSLSDDFKLHVIAYCSVITLMVIMAWSRKVGNPSYNYVGIGAVLFLISDSLIAFNKFYAEIPLSSLWVMSTYGAAQYLILEGWIKRANSF